MLYTTGLVAALVAYPMWPACLAGSAVGCVGGVACVRVGGVRAGPYADTMRHGTNTRTRSPRSYTIVGELLPGAGAGGRCCGLACLLSLSCFLPSCGLVPTLRMTRPGSLSMRHTTLLMDSLRMFPSRVGFPNLGTTLDRVPRSVPRGFAALSTLSTLCRPVVSMLAL